MNNNNSLKAFYEGEFSGRFSKKRFNVLDFITNNPNLTRQEVSKQMDAAVDGEYPINVICGRVTELIEAKLITDSKESPRGKLTSNFVEVAA